MVAEVALRKESVDRNTKWQSLMISGRVALRKESVDRNDCYQSTYGKLPRSLSARRAWIEMHIAAVVSQRPPVALRKESVDRNVAVAGAFALLRGRSPQGERG